MASQNRNPRACLVFPEFGSCVCVFLLVPGPWVVARNAWALAREVFSLIPSLACLWIGVSISLSQGFYEAGKRARQNLPHLLCNGVRMRRRSTELREENMKPHPWGHPEGEAAFWVWGSLGSLGQYSGSNLNPPIRIEDCMRLVPAGGMQQWWCMCWGVPEDATPWYAKISLSLAYGLIWVKGLWGLTAWGKAPKPRHSFPFVKEVDMYKGKVGGLHKS